MNKIFVAIILALALIGFYLEFYSGIKKHDTDASFQFEQMR